jgi:hypothetical protein
VTGLFVIATSGVQERVIWVSEDLLKTWIAEGAYGPVPIVTINSVEYSE